MKIKFLPYFICPVDKSPLFLKDETCDGDDVISGTLVSEKDGNSYKIEKGIPNFVLEKNQAQKDTLELFSHEWSHYDQWGWLDKYPEIQDGALIYKGALKEEALSSFVTKAPFVEGDLENDKVVLDAGCGNGRHARLSSEMVGTLFCVDASDAIYIAHENLKHKDNICFVKADILNLPFMDNTMDATYSIGVMQHTGDANSFIKSLLRVTKEQSPVTINCYGRGLPTYELVDYLIRLVVTKASTPCQMRFASALARFDRFLLKLNGFGKFVHAALYANMCILTSDCILYDWYAPKLAEHYSVKRIQSMANTHGGVITKASPDFLAPDYNDFNRARTHGAFSFRMLKKAI